MSLSAPPDNQRDHPSSCEQEPVRFPGCIQSHGVLIVLDEDLKILQISANAEKHLGQTAQSLVNTPVLELFAASQRESIKASVRHAGIGISNPFPVFVEVSGEFRLFDGIAHAIPEGRIIFELEVNPAAGGLPAAGLDHHLNLIARSIRFTNDLTETSSFASIMAQEVKNLTGFDRVMIYRLCPDFHGHVIAEAVEDGMKPFLGLHYPASDIPAQARELYKTNLVRMVPDVDAAVSCLTPAAEPGVGKPLDMSRAVLRALSPIHLQYVRNMGVRSSFSVSLVAGDALWGLIICHNRSPRHVPYSIRSTAALYGTIMTALIEAKRNHRSHERVSAARGQALSLLTGIHDVAGPEGDLAVMMPKLTGFFGATGAVLIADSRLQLTGATPGETTVGHLREELLRSRVRPVVVTHRAGEEFPSLVPAASTAAGLVGIHLGSDWLILLRGEKKRRVTWAGDPFQAKVQGENGLPTPRKDFEPWIQVIDGESEPWPEETEALALEIRAGLLEIIQRRNITLARTNDDLRRFAGTVAHEVKNHLQTGIMALALVEESSQASLATELLQIVSLGRGRLTNLNTFVEELLAFSKTEISSKMTLIDLNTIAAETAKELEVAGITGDARIRIAPLPQVWGYETQFRHVVANLLRNALIHARDGHRALNIEIGTRSDADAEVVYVRDDGRGISREHREKIFEYFFRGDGQSVGSGIGLAFCYQALDRMGQKIWVEDAKPRGSAFCFTVRTAPIAPPAFSEPM